MRSIGAGVGHDHTDIAIQQLACAAKQVLSPRARVVPAVAYFPHQADYVCDVFEAYVHEYDSTV